MGQFIHNENDEIIIIDGSGNQSVYNATWWIANEEVAYVLPPSAISQYYRQTEIYAYHTAAEAIIGSIPWADGDTYISKKATYDADYLVYTLSTLANAKTYQIGLLQQYWSNFTLTGNVTYLGTLFNSSLKSQWKEEMEYANRNTNLLSGHYVLDTVNNRVNMSISTLNEFVDLLDEFFWVTKKVYDDHVDAINAINTTIADVLAYDYTTTWSSIITPYDNGLTLYSSYASSIDADYAGGTVTGTATGGAAIAATYLDLAHSDARYVDYDGTSNVDNQQTGSIIFTVKPNYSGTPAADKVFFAISKADGDSHNLIQLVHKITTGHLHLILKDSADASIADIDFGAWSPTSGTDYKISVHYQLTGTGENWLKINDVQLGSTDTSTGTRDAAIDLLRIGSGYNSAAAEVSNFSIKNLHISSK